MRPSSGVNEDSTSPVQKALLAFLRQSQVMRWRLQWRQRSMSQSPWWGWQRPAPQSGQALIRDIGISNNRIRLRLGGRYSYRAWRQLRLLEMFRRLVVVEGMLTRFVRCCNCRTRGHLSAVALATVKPFPAATGMHITAPRIASWSTVGRTTTTTQQPQGKKLPLNANGRHAK